MSRCVFRPGSVSDEKDVVKLNAESVEVTSPMDGSRFRSLFEMCSLVTMAELDGDVVGFLMGFNEGSAYDNVNYRWFASRLKRFFYIDRIIVSEQCRGSGLGREFYSRVESWATNENMLWLAAEMDLEPPNSTSLRFHERSGFVPVGTQVLKSGKVVSMQIRPIGSFG